MVSRPQISYSAPAVFLSSDNWLQIRNALSQLFPLKDLLWTSSFRPATRTIHELSIDFVSLDDVRDGLPSVSPPAITSRPLVNLFVVSCDDAEVYKNSVKKQIKDWHALVIQKKHQEWLILLVVRSDTRASSGFFSSAKSNILDKIKADFNADKRDRCLQVNWAPGIDSQGLWEEVRQKLSEGLLSAFDAAVSQREEEVRKSEGQRQMPGWNFCKFFLLKESLAKSFEGMGLLEDALLQYEELEAAFFQVTKEKNLSWFGKLINPDPEDDSLPILALDKKPYRDLILANSITVFDIRVYLLAIQSEILGRQQLFVEIIRKVQIEVASIANILKILEEELPPGFIASWCFSAAMTTIEHCDELASDDEEDPLFSSAKAELLEISLSQLNSLGISCNYLSPQPALHAKLAKSTDSFRVRHLNAGTLTGITNQELRRALKSADHFREFYGGLTERAIDLYVKGGRRKFAVKLHGLRAGISRLRGDYGVAQRSFKSLQAHYGPSKWSGVEAYVTGQYLESFWSASTPKDKEWAEFVLNFMHSLSRCTPEDQESIVLSSNLGSRFVNIVSEVQDVLSSIGEELKATDHPIFHIRLDPSSVSLCNKAYGSIIYATVGNKWPSTLHLDRINVIARGFRETEIVYQAEKVALPPGVSVVQLRCLSPASGTYIHVRSLVIMGLIQFDYPQLRWPPQVEPWSPVLPSYSPLIFTVPKSYEGVDLQVMRDRHIRVGQRNTLLFTLYLGRHPIEAIVVSLQTADGVRLHVQETTLRSIATSVKLHVEDGTLRLEALSREKQITLAIPFDSHTRTTLPFEASLSYELPIDGVPSVITALFHRTVDVTLPLSVKVRDVFRSKSLYSLYQVTSNLLLPVTIKSAKLSLEQTDLDISIRSISKHNAPLIANPTDPVNFVFELHSKTPRTSSCSLLLEIEFQTRLDEMKEIISRQAEKTMKEERFRSIGLNERRVVDMLLEALATTDTWGSDYNIRGNTLQRIAGLSGAQEECAHQILEALANSSQHEASWSSLTIPFELPFMNIVLVASLELHPTGAENGSVACMFAGQPASVDITITSTFHWGLEAGHGSDSYPMTFSVQEAKHDWLLSGRTRGEFLAKDGGVFRQTMTLIPLHHGKLALPAIDVQPLIQSGVLRPPSSECYQAHGAQRITVVPRGGRSTFVVSLAEE